MIYYAYVQRPGEAIFRQPILAYQRKKQVIGGTEIPELSVMLEPDSNGVIAVNDKHENLKQIRAALDKAMKDLNQPKQAKRLVGPFEDDKDGKITGYQKALLASVQERPKTADEQVAIKDAEIAELKAKLAEKEPKGKPGDEK